MTLISMAVHDTEENNRTGLTWDTLQSLHETVDFQKHRLFIIDNGSCEPTKLVLEQFKRLFLGAKYPPEHLNIITLEENIGTARAVNKGWAHRKPGEHAIKMDNDVVIYSKNWVEELEYCVEKWPKLGIVGLKRKDCWENPNHEHAHLRSRLVFLPQQPGERWVPVEIVNHVMGTCQIYNSALLDKIGYLYQPRLYGFDDSLAAQRSHFAGFLNAFLPHIEIDHIDPPNVVDAPYTKWKQQHSSEDMAAYQQIVKEYKSGERSIYCEADYKE